MNGNPLASLPAEAQSFDLDNSVTLAVGTYPSVTNDQTPTFSGTTDGRTVKLFNGSTFLGDFTVTDGTWSITSSTLNFGNYTLRVEATDSLDNKTSRDIPVSISQAPAQPSVRALEDDAGRITTPLTVSGGTTDDRSPVLTGESAVSSTLIFYSDGVEHGRIQSAANGTWRYPLSDLAKGTYTFTVKTVNGTLESPLSAPFTFTVNPDAPAEPTLGVQGQITGGRTSNNLPTLSGTAPAGTKVEITNGSAVIASNIAVSDPDGDGVGAWTWTPASPLADAPYDFTARAINGLGVVSGVSDTYALTIDVTPPTVTASAFPTSVKSGGASTVTFTFSEALDGATMIADSFAFAGAGGLSTFRVNGNTVTMMFTPAENSVDPATISLKADPSNAGRALIKDLAGNAVLLATAPSATISVDTRAPTLSRVERVTAAGAATAERTNATTLRFALTFSETVKAIPANAFVLLDGAGNRISGWTPVVTGIGDKRVVTFTNTAAPNAPVPYEGRARLGFASGINVADAPGNSAAAAVPADAEAYTLDYSISLAVDPYNAVTTDRSPTFTGTSDGDVVTLYNSRTVFTDATKIGEGRVNDGRWTVSPTNPLVLGAYPNLTIRVTDAAGNVRDDRTVSVTVSEAPDQARITGFEDNVGTITTPGSSGDTTDDTSPVLTGSTPAGTTVTVYEVTRDGTSFVYSNPRTATVTGETWRLELSGLANGTSLYAAASKNSAGVTSPRSAPFSIVVNTAPPLAPVISRAVDDVGLPTVVTSGDVTNDATPILVIAAGSDAAKVTIHKTTGADTGKIGDATKSADGAWSWTPSTALPEGPYTFTAKAVSAAGVTSGASAALMLTVDSTRPALLAASALAPGLKSGDTTTVSFTFSEALDVSTVTAADFAVSGGLGTLEAPIFSDGDKTLTLTLRPTADSVGQATVSFAPSAEIRDVAGNLLSVAGNSVSAAIAIDAQPPSLTAPSLSVLENAGAVTLGQIMSNDASAVFAMSDASGKFVLDADGTIRTRPGATFDYEAGTRSFAIALTATDSAGNVTTKDVTVAVTDVNEAPSGVILAGGQVTVGEAGAIAGTLSAVDPDTGAQAFSFVSKDARFEVQGNVLRLRPGVSLSTSDGASTRVEVEVTDGGGLRVAVVVNVVIIPQATFQATFQQSPQQEPQRNVQPSAALDLSPNEGSNPIRAVKTKLESLLRGAVGEPINLTFASRTVNTVTIGLDGTVIGPATTGSFNARPSQAVFEFSSALRGSFIDISVQYGTSSTAFSALEQNSAQVASVDVRALDGAASGSVTLENDVLRVSRAAGDIVRVAIEIRLKTGEVLRQILTIDTRTGGIETSISSPGASLHGPSFDAMVASLLQGRHAQANKLADAFF